MYYVHKTAKCNNYHWKAAVPCLTRELRTIIAASTGLGDVLVQETGGRNGSGSMELHCRAVGTYEVVVRGVRYSRTEGKQLESASEWDCGLEARAS